MRTKSIETKSVGRESVRIKSIETKSVWVKKKKRSFFGTVCRDKVDLDNVRQNR